MINCIAHNRMQSMQITQSIVGMRMTIQSQWLQSSICVIKQANYIEVAYSICKANWMRLWRNDMRRYFFFSPQSLFTHFNWILVLLVFIEFLHWFSSLQYRSTECFSVTFHFITNLTIPLTIVMSNRLLL